MELQDKIKGSFYLFLCLSVIFSSAHFNSQLVLLFLALVSGDRIRDPLTRQ